jgi:hexosaminidase
MPELTLTSCPGVLDATNDKVYVFLLAFLSEMAGLFPDEVMMLGGDEVGLGCRNQTTGLAELTRVFDIDPNAGPWLRARNLTGHNATHYFWQRLSTQIFPKLKKSGLMVWFCPTCHTGDPPVLSMPHNTIANVWGTIDYAAEAAKAGFHTVLSMSGGSSYGSGWYLPYGAGNSGCLWPGAYTRDPAKELTALGCDEAALSLVDGGSAAAWSGDHTTFDDFVWQGTMAVAERLWSGGGAQVRKAPSCSRSRANFSLL